MRRPTGMSLHVCITVSLSAALLEADNNTHAYFVEVLQAWTRQSWSCPQGCREGASSQRFSLELGEWGPSAHGMLAVSVPCCCRVRPPSCCWLSLGPLLVPEGHQTPSAHGPPHALCWLESLLQEEPSLFKCLSWLGWCHPHNFSFN